MDEGPPDMGCSPFQEVVRNKNQGRKVLRLIEQAKNYSVYPGDLRYRLLMYTHFVHMIYDDRDWELKRGNEYLE